MVRNGRSQLPFAAVEAKVQRPVHRDGLIARTRLVEAFAATPERVCLILVTAPAGYGKTTALSQWAAEDSREFAWVTVDEADEVDDVRVSLRNEPARGTLGAPAGVTLHHDRRVAVRERFGRPRRELTERDVDRARDVAARPLVRLAHVEDGVAFGREADRLLDPDVAQRHHGADPPTDGPARTSLSIRVISILLRASWSSSRSSTLGSERPSARMFRSCVSASVHTLSTCL